MRGRDRFHRRHDETKAIAQIYEGGIGGWAGRRVKNQPPRILRYLGEQLS